MGLVVPQKEILTFMFLFDSVFKSIVMVDWVISRDIALVLDNFEEPIFGLFYTPRRRTLKKYFEMLTKARLNCINSDVRSSNTKIG